MTAVPSREELDALPTVPQWTMGSYPWLDWAPETAGRARVIIDNDFSGDPDDLFQLVHHLLTPSVDIRGVVASHLRPDDPIDAGPDTAANAEAVALGVFARMGLTSTELVIRGASHGLGDQATPRESAAARFIVAEAMREDTEAPLFYCAGGGLTDLASAILIEPRIAERMTLIWIGGEEHADLAFPPPQGMPVEYNLLIDIEAGRVVFDAGVEIWQIPRNVYRQCLVSEIELRRRVKDAGPLGRYLFDETWAEIDRQARAGHPTATYALGDSPLVLLTALRSTFEPDPSSSYYSLRPTPALTADGAYRPVAGRRPMRVYTHVDTRLMFEDMFLRIGEFSDWQRTHRS